MHVSRLLRKALAELSNRYEPSASTG
jgi:hypothetical protein